MWFYDAKIQASLFFYFKKNYIDLFLAARNIENIPKKNWSFKGYFDTIIMYEKLYSCCWVLFSY